MVGTALMPNFLRTMERGSCSMLKVMAFFSSIRADVSGLPPTCTATNSSPWSLRSWYAASILGMSFSQYVHPSAQKSITTTSPFRSPGMDTSVPSRAMSLMSGALCPIFTAGPFEHPDSPYMRTRDRLNSTSILDVIFTRILKTTTFPSSLAIKRGKTPIKNCFIPCSSPVPSFCLLIDKGICTSGGLAE